MYKTFEQFVSEFLHKVATGRKIEYSSTLKAFVIPVNSWFQLTVYLNDLMDEWQARTEAT